MKRIINLLFVCILFISFLAGCSFDDPEISARKIKDPSQMPDIVFIKEYDYTDVFNEYDDVQYRTEFFDKQGNYYVTFDPYVYFLSYDELIKEFVEGKLDDKIQFTRSCDVDALFENYQKLCKVSRNKDYKIVHPEVVPAVETEKLYYYGLYYNKKGEIRSILFHEYGPEHFEANDELANEIYEWYLHPFE